MNKNLIILSLLGVIGVLLVYIATDRQQLRPINDQAEQSEPQVPVLPQQLTEVETAAQQKPSETSTAVETDAATLPVAVDARDREPAPAEGEETSVENADSYVVERYIPQPRKKPVPAKPLPAAEREQLVARNNQAVDVLTPMITEYNDNLFSPEARKRIEKSVSENSAAFKETALRLAKDQLAIEAEAAR